MFETRFALRPLFPATIYPTQTGDHVSTVTPDPLIKCKRAETTCQGCKPHIGGTVIEISQASSIETHNAAADRMVPEHIFKFQVRTFRLVF
jgi:hypothetical protein